MGDGEETGADSNQLQAMDRGSTAISPAHAPVQMARELGLTPKKFGKLANHHQEPWKRPLPDFIAALYVKRFGKPIPAVVKTIEEIAAAALAKKRAKKTRKPIASQPPNEQGSVAQTE
jgi:hypothetical protein